MKYPLIIKLTVPLVHANGSCSPARGGCEDARMRGCEGAKRARMRRREDATARRCGAAWMRPRGCEAASREAGAQTHTNLFVPATTHGLAFRMQGHGSSRGPAHWTAAARKCAWRPRAGCEHETATCSRIVVTARAVTPHTAHASRHRCHSAGFSRVCVCVCGSVCHRAVCMVVLRHHHPGPLPC